MQTLITGTRTLLGRDLTPAQVAAFARYAAELTAWNDRFNLTAIIEPEAVQVKHFLDSLTVALALPDLDTPWRVVDVGTGAGFPGLPLKVVWPHLRLTLVEATGKKITFCQHMMDTLNLAGVRVLKARAEELGREPAHREHYDVAVARAVAEMPVLAEYLLPLVQRGGRVIAQKGKDAPAEAHAAEAAIRKLGGDLERVIPVELPGVAEPRHLVVLRKVAATPPAYPRRPGTPSKEPLR